MCPIAVQLSRIFEFMESTIMKGTPAIRKLYGSQFPRWRILGTLFTHNMDRGVSTGAIPAGYSVGGVVPPRENIFWDNAAWQSFASLQFRCRSTTLCGKRGCEKAGSISCVCEAVKYCSENCQTKCVVLSVPAIPRLLTTGQGRERSQARMRVDALDIGYR